MIYETLAMLGYMAATILVLIGYTILTLVALDLGKSKILKPWARRTAQVLIVLLLAVIPLWLIVRAMQ